MEDERIDISGRFLDAQAEPNGTEQRDHGKADGEAPQKQDRRQDQLETLIRRVYQELTVHRRFSGRFTASPLASASEMAIVRLHEAAEILEMSHPEEARAIREIIATLEGEADR